MAAPMSGALLLSACATVPSAPPPPAPTAFTPATGRAPPSLLGLDAKHLFAEYGAPRLDIRERTVRKLQFANGKCILDTYLYAPAEGREPVVTHVDARLPDGRDTDPAACALQMKK